jgi:RimJ/RimL family protein N-acetyltransferase
MEAQRPTWVFDNALGEADEQERFERTRTAFAVLDANDEPLAIAGVWDCGWGREEVGVDVRRDARGQGLAKAVVTAATHSILEAGRVPYYSCGATNVRSHNNAIACGFRPVFTRAAVSAGVP